MLQVDDGAYIGETKTKEKFRVAVPVLLQVVLVAPRAASH